ncbi:MAG TPA: DUF4239 domain-containing protein [Candidatus Kapabacteria bacterium]|jgi:uncharacterized membrane protein
MFDQLSLPVYATLCIVFAVVASILGLSLFHRLVEKSHLKEAHEVTGFVYAMVGVIYAVLLAFVVVVVWEQFQDANQIAEDEAAHLGNVRQLAKAFPDSVSKAISNEVRAYATAVIVREWPAMAQGHSDSTAYGITKRLWNIFYSYRPIQGEQEYYNQALRELTSFNTSRRQRIIGMYGTIPSILWALLIGGAIVCIVFTYMFVTPRAWTQYMITGLLAAMITVTLVLIHEMDRPYRGAMSLQPDGFEFVLHGPAALK